MKKEEAINKVLEIAEMNGTQLDEFSQKLGVSSLDGFPRVLLGKAIELRRKDLMDKVSPLIEPCELATGEAKGYA